MLIDHAPRTAGAAPKFEITPSGDDRTIFNALDQGLCVVEVEFDDTGKACDYVFLDFNPAFERHTGLADALGKSMRTLRPEHEEHWFEAYGAIARTGEPRRFVAEAAALGRWYDVYAFRLGDAGENRVAILFDDITERKRKEEHYALLNREIDHRARNVLALLSSLIQLTTADSVKEYKATLLGRLQALARSQRALTDDRNNVVAYGELVRSELAPYHIETAERVRHSGPVVKLGPDRSQCMAMVLHELATNAVKYGALSRADGRVTVSWSVRHSRLHTVWDERGGPATTAPARHGVGTIVIMRCIRDQLGGEIAFEWGPAGLHCEFSVPVTPTRNQSNATQ
jgi:two-component system, chemotaxis family, CheB/CheR fusion protein